MSNYRQPRHYRKIYEQHYGPIPKDEQGRTYQIHHIDGDHTNNDPSNLKAVSIREHYDIHYAQGDWAACLRLAQTMQTDHETKSQLARLSCLKRIANGTHPWIGGKSHRQLISQGRWYALGPEHNRRQVEKGTHPWLGGEVSRRVTKRRMEDGTHNFLTMTQEERREKQMRLVRSGRHHFLGDSNPVYRQIEQGTHNFLGGEIQRQHNQRRVKDGTHHLLGGEVQRRTLVEGKHSSQIKVTCPHCSKVGAKPSLSATHFDYCSKNPNRIVRPHLTCPHCDKTGPKNVMMSNHFDKCPQSPNYIPREAKPRKQLTCPHCNKTGATQPMKRWHFDKCKSRTNLICE